MQSEIDITVETNSKIDSDFRNTERSPKADDPHAQRGFEPMNDRLTVFNLDNTFVVQDSTSKAVRESKPLF